MPKRAIISDIHGNLVALEAVLADIDRMDVAEIVCLGDICGYGPQPIECIDLIRKRAAFCLRGNHDEALFIEPKEFGTNALLAIAWQRSILEPKPDSTREQVERWEWLRNLPTERRERDVQFVHASPRDPIYEYVLREDFDDAGNGPTQKAKDIFGAMEWLCFCGHSHRPGVVAEDFKWWLPSELENGIATLKRGFKTIVNIGSVGQPRDGIPDACYVIFEYDPPGQPGTKRPLLENAGSGTFVQVRETKAKPPDGAEDDTRYGEELNKARDTAMLSMPRVLFRRIPYDIEEAQARFRAIKDLPPNNALRLSKGI